MKICESRLVASQMPVSEPCELCHTSYLKRRRRLKIDNHTILVSIQYEHCLKPIGFALGKHAYSITLVPGEELEVEVSATTTTTEETNETLTTEQSYTEELSTTLQQEVSTRSTMNIGASIKGGGSIEIEIIELGSDTEAEFKYETESFSDLVLETSQKATSQVNSKYELSMGLKKETTTSTSSIRTLRNLNTCQTVTYHYFQIMRKYLASLKVVSVRFSVLDQQNLPLLLKTKYNGVIAKYARRSFSNLDTALGSRAIGTAEVTVTQVDRQVSVATVDPGSVVGAPLTATITHPSLGSELELQVRETTLDKLVQDLSVKSADDFKSGITKLLDELGLVAGNVVTSYEVCMNTTGLYADATTGACAACDTHTANIYRLEEEKLALEVEQLRRAMLNGFIATGYVRGGGSGVASVNVALQLTSGETIAETVSTETGFYQIAATDALEIGTEYMVRVTKIPSPFTVASEPPAFLWEGQGQSVNLTLS